MTVGSWLEELEAKLEQQLEVFLRSNPYQQELMAEQQAQDQWQRLLSQRQVLQAEAENQRQALLALANEIHQWQARVNRARAADAVELMRRAQAHLENLTQQGRQRWHCLAELGQRFRLLEEQLEHLARLRQASARTEPSASHAAAEQVGPIADAADLEAEWLAFEADQEIQQLRQNLHL